MSIIAFATSMLAVSCGKTADPNTNTNNNANNSGGNNSGGDGGGGNGGGCTGICPTGKLNLTSAKAYVKISGNTMNINAAGWAADVNPHARTADADRGLNNIYTSGTLSSHNMFDITYSGGTVAAMIFLTRGHVTKDTIAIGGTTCTTSETTDNTAAARPEGNVCKNTGGGRALELRSFLGTVFANPDTAKARGAVGCWNTLKHNTGGPAGNILTDSSMFNESAVLSCSIVPVNNGGTAGTAEIDDAWVADAASVKEVEFYAIGIDVAGKAISSLSDAAGFNLAALNGAQNNASIKEMLKKNPWAELKFKARIINAAAFAALP